jgi:hypothetical protein
MILKSFWFWFIAIFIGIQFITVDVPAKVETNPKYEIEAPKEVMSILKRSCYDCHSNASTYPWYDRIAPASWFVKNHVKNGRKVVNFSIWKTYDAKKQRFFAEKLGKSVVIRMPMPSYLWLHPNAKLSNEDRKILKAWGENLKEKIK